jgi:transcriptional regulator with XRE-family HTH domain
VPTLRVPDRVGDLGLYLKEQREQAKLSLRELAKAAGVSNPYLSQIERGLRKPSAEVLQQIAKGLQISAEALYLRAGILDDSRGVAVEVAIQTDNTLTQRQRRVMLDIYASFQAENARVTPTVAETLAQEVPAPPAPDAATPSRTAAAKRATKRSSTAPAAPKTIEGPDDTAQAR